MQDLKYKIKHGAIFSEGMAPVGHSFICGKKGKKEM
jgi:hypothetical protein